MTRPSRILLLALAALLPGGCADSGLPVAPRSVGTGPTLTPAPGGPSFGLLATYRTPPTSTTASARAWIGPEGGRLEFEGFAIGVPAGAVEHATEFSIHLPSSGQASEDVVAEFEPRAVEFAVPVTIELPYAGTSIEGEEGAVFEWDVGTHGWIDREASLTADGRRLQLTTALFARYGAGRAGRSGVVTTSGGRAP